MIKCSVYSVFPGVLVEEEENKQIKEYFYKTF